MYKVLLRFNFVKNNRVIEVYFDNRLSFRENFRLLSYIVDISDIENIKIYDENKHMFLKTDVPIKNFNINYFMNYKIY